MNPLKVFFATIIMVPQMVHAQERYNFKVTDEDPRKIVKWALKELKRKEYVSRTDIWELANKVTIDVKNATVFDVLDYCFQQQKKISYRFSEDLLIIEKKVKKPGSTGWDIHLKAWDKDYNSIPGVTVQLKNKPDHIQTDRYGISTLQNVSIDDTGRD